MPYFENIKSYEELKAQYKQLCKKNHPDAGGDPEIMKAINAEFAQVFPYWRNRKQAETGAFVNESAESVRRKFYSENGWEGSRYSEAMTTKEICQRIREYVKETYPGYKFSVRFSTASMCSEIYVTMKESPYPVYKPFDDLTGREALKPFGWNESNGYWGDSDIAKVWSKAQRNQWVPLGGCYNEEMDAKLRECYEKESFLKIYTEITQAVVDDVNNYVNSYRYEDVDGMTDYFDVSDYYFGCEIADNIKIVPKTPRIKATKAEPAQIDPDAITDHTSSGEYEITETEHTKTHEKIWIVKVLRKLTREEYLETADTMKKAGGYYSRYVHGFVFKQNPAAMF